MVPDLGDITADHSPSPIYMVTNAAALEGTPHTLLPATAAYHSSSNGCSHYPSHHDNDRHSHTLSHTHHFPHRCDSHTPLHRQSHSCSSRSCHTAQDSQPRKIKQWPRPSTPIKYTPQTVTIQDSPSDYSSDSDSDSDPLNYQDPLPLVMKMSGQGIPQTTTP